MKSNTSERLKYLMDTFNLKQIDILNKCSPICERYGVKMGRNDISQYVSGKVTPKQDKLSILACALNVNEAWLMGYDVPMARSETYNNSNSLGNIDWKKTLNFQFTDEEIKKIIEYSEFLLSQRKK